MELRHVDSVYLARALRVGAVEFQMGNGAIDVQQPEVSDVSPTTKALVLGVVVLCLLRAIAAAVLPLSADEAYYWLWSRHLAAGYFDHPPAIAYLIRAGTMLFGATPWGVRAGPFVSSLIATWLIAQSATSLLGRAKDGARAALYFNLTLMVGAEMLAATPDAPAMLFSAGFLYALARLEGSGEGAWWLFAGICAGLALLSKYTALFLGLGTGLWLLLTAEGRRWLRTAWPYAGGVLAGLIFAPNLVWNAEHHWQTFAFQFARIGSGEFSLRFLGEFIAAQLGLATPFILLLSADGAATASKISRQRLLVFLVVPAVAYFVAHALHDRVQANWTSFLFPMICVLAAIASGPSKSRARFRKVSRAAAVPVAAVMLSLTYAQAIFGIIPIGRADPLSRLLGFGVEEVSARVQDLRAQMHAGGVVTTDYATAAWLSFYTHGHTPVLILSDDVRWEDAATAPASLIAQPVLYVVEDRHDARASVLRSFNRISFVADIARDRGRVRIARYLVYRLSSARAGGPVLHAL